MNRIAVLAFVISVLFSAQAMQSLGQRSQPSGSDLPSLVQESDAIGELDLRSIETALSSSKFADRQHAMWLLGEDPDKTASLVQQAKRSFSPEVAARAEWIEKAWQRGVLFGEDGGDLAYGMGASRLDLLLDQGRFDAVLFALGATVDGQSYRKVKSKVANLLSTRFASVAQRALESQQLSKLVEIIDVVAESRDLAVCRLQLLQWMGADLKVKGLLPECAKDWTADQCDEIMVLLLYQAGEVEEAIAQARRLENKQSLHSCLILDSRWNELADEAMIVVNDSEAGSEAFTQAWSRILIAADRSGNQELRREAIETLSEGVLDESDKVRGMRWRSLAMHGQIEAALVIADQQRIASSIDLSLAASRPERTFALLGHPLELVDSQYAEWVDQALKRQKASQKLGGLSRFVCPEVEKLMQLINCLSAVGRDDVAFVIAKRFCERWKVEISGSSDSIASIRKSLVERLSPVIRKQWIEKLVLVGNSNGDPKKLAPSDKSLLADSISDCDFTTLSLLLDAVRELQESETLSDQLAAVCQIARGNTYAGVNVDKVLESMMASINKRFDAPRWKAQVPAPFLKDVYGLLLKHGRHELAGAYLRQHAGQGGVDAMLRLAESELSTGSMAKAKELFSQIETLAGRRKATTQRSTFGSVGVWEVAKVKALVGRLVCARRIGDQTLATSLKNKLEVILCSPSLEFRMEIASYLREYGETDLATQVYKALVPIAALPSDYMQTTSGKVSLYDVTLKYVLTIEKEQPSEAARLFDIAVIGMVDSGGYLARAYVALPLMIQEWRLQAAVSAKDRDTAVESVQRILELDPLDISFSEEQLPLMRTAGMEQIADTVLDQIVDAGVDHAERFSHDAMTCNNVAWVAAKNQRRLNDALDLAMLAVRAEPESTTYRDTLAEILFLLGRKEEALQIEQACLLDDPGQWHLHEQIKKFANGIQQEKP
ncbi:MAG: hypothetical protein GY924_14675 [Planctomycetaceae bacterium]|nr:hypothetical protein [Planctomycetaceae bacterium]